MLGDQLCFLGLTLLRGRGRDGACLTGNTESGEAGKSLIAELPIPFLPFSAGGNPAIPDSCESDQRSDQATALQPAAPG